MAIICVITGYFKNFIIFTSIIIIHELGHLVSAIYYKWKIEKVILLPFGGITIFNEKIDKPLKEEFIIAISGVLFQFIFFLLYKDNYLFLYYNYFLFVFNLLPIYPLDGSKIMNIIFNKITSFKYSHFLTIIISFVGLSILIYYSFRKELLFLFILLFLIINNFKELLKHKYYFNKFLLERYLYSFNYKKIKTIKKLEQMKKQTKHLFLIDNRYYTEREIIHKRFDK